MVLVASITALERRGIPVEPVGEVPVCATALAAVVARQASMLAVPRAVPRLPPTARPALASMAVAVAAETTGVPLVLLPPLRTLVARAVTILVAPGAALPSRLPRLGTTARAAVAGRAAARELEAAGEGQQAEVQWRRAAEDPLKSPTDPGEPWSENYYFKALALEHVHRESEARALYTRLAALDNDERMLAAEADPPRGAIRYVLAGLALRALGQSERARIVLARALQMDPGNELAKTAVQGLGKRGALRGDNSKSR
ncbi:MAG: hypothetical protein ACLPYS_13480, partial [Vulcanimicrobiaceae bacterium]